MSDISDLTDGQRQQFIAAHALTEDVQAAMMEFLAAHAAKDTRAMGQAQIHLALVMKSMSAATGVCLAIQEFEKED